MTENALIETKKPYSVNNIVFYKDLNINFKQNIDKALVDNQRAINEEIYLLLRTRIGERVFEPTYGSNLFYFLGKPVNESVGNDLLLDLFSSITRWLSDRIKLSYPNCFVIPDKERQTYYVSLAYTFTKLQQIGSYEFKLERENND
jgi:phage baseplate assembly protein W